MSLKKENDLNPTSRNQVARAKTAAQSKNYDYAITLLQAVLKDEPLFLDGRRLLRAVEIQKYKTMGTFTRQVVSMRNTGGMMKLSTGKKTPQEQLIAAEEVLASDPFNTKANAMVGEAGVELGYPEFKCFSYEVLAEAKEKPDKATLHTLAQAYMAAQQPTKAINTYEKILEIDARDGDALSGLRNAEAARSHENWAGAEKKAKEGDEKSFRDALKSEEESGQLEQEGKVVKSADAIQEQIELVYQKLQEEPNNLNHPKKIAALSEQRNDYAQAVQWYQYAFDLGGKVDSALEKHIGDLRLKLAEKELRDLRDQLAATTDAEQQAAIQTAIDTKTKDYNDAKLSLAEARVRAQPNEGEFRYELGSALFAVGEYKRATAELQESLKQPSVRYQALNLLGLSFMKRGMLDFAANRLTLAQSELLPMDDMKKEVTYNLGLVYEASKDEAKALDEWKKIYEVDMSYRDVAARVEASYSNGNEAA
jgi:tetratricopeptide (TPR) repeat protein